MKRALLASAIAIFSMNALSAEMVSDGSAWDFVEAGYQVADVDGFEPSEFSLKSSMWWVKTFS